MRTNTRSGAAQYRPSIDTSKPATTGVAAETAKVEFYSWPPGAQAQVRLPWCASSEVQ